MRTIGYFIISFLFLPLPIKKEQPVLNPLQEKQFNFHLPFLSYSFPLAPTNKITGVDTNQLKQSGWYADALKGIEESEYEIKYNGASKTYASPNRQNNLRSFYSAKTFTLLPRSENNWELQLSTLGVYTGKQLIYAPDENASVTQNEKSIRFNHNNNFITEYINSKEGVRQNFIIEKEPASKPQTLNIKLQTNAGWFVNKVHDKEIHFSKETATGYYKKITYNDLKVWDATGKELKSFFTTEENSISINVNTENAVYPVMVDPLSTGTAGTADWAVGDANQVTAYSGLSVASAGDVNGDGYSDVIIGAYAFDDGTNTDEGRAFVYFGSATGLSTTPNNTPDDADQSLAYFGITLASAGDVNGDGYSDVIIGATGYDEGVNADEGRAFLYYGSATGLSTVPDNILDDADKPESFLGTGVACAGDVNGDGYSDVIVGAYGYDDGPNNYEGRAFVYHGSAIGLSATPNSTPDDADQADARFGVSVASAGDVNGDGYSDVIIGSHFYTDGTNTNEGRAFLYYGSPTGISTSPDSTPDDADQAFSFFGRSVACAGDVNGDGYSDVIIGAFQYDDGFTDEGKAFVYYGSAAGISASPNSTPDDGDQSGVFFGWQVAGAGDVNGDGYSDVIIGANFYDDGGNTDEGRAFVYYGGATGLSASPVSMPDDANQAGANFGWSVSAAGDVNGDGYSDVIIGAVNYDDGANTDEGRSFVYHGAPDGLSVAPLEISNITQDGAYFGFNLNSAGDVNADGYSDVIIGAIYYDDGANSNEGRAYVYYGSATGISATASVVLDEANQANAFFGYSCASAGDVNGDGYGDVIVGALGYNGIGRAYIYFGNSTGLPLTSNQVLDGTQVGEGFGSSVSGAGDVNKDGYSDVIIGSYNYDDGVNTDEGRALIYHGSATGLNTTPARIVSDANQPSAGFGYSVSSAGDINGDGFGDVIVGAYLYNNGVNTDEGAVFVYYGNLSGIPATANLMVTGASQAVAYFGFSCAGAGDLNGDGFSDVVVGSFFYNSRRGRAYVFNGSSAGLSTSPFILENTISGSNAGDYMGTSVSSAGDINGDGYSDIIVGIPEYNNPFSDGPQGRAFVYLGKSTGVAATPDIIITDNANNHVFFGYAVACAGDVNGDGFSDILSGGPRGSWPGYGRAWIYYGNDKGGLRNNLRLYNSDLVTPMNRTNINDPNLFGAGLYSKSFLGKQKGKLVWQTARNGNPFPGVPITNNTAYTAQQPTFSNLGLMGIELKSQIAKMVPTRVTYIRARVRYDLVTAITGQVYGPWRYPEGFLRGKREIADVALPVKFLSFTVSKEKETVLVKWITSNEEPGVQYEIQHSTDGNHFTQIQTITAQLHLRNEYEYLHLKPSAGNNYYRIKAFLQSKESFTDVRVVNFPVFHDKPLFYPNPVRKNETVSINLPANISGSVNVRIINHAGQKIFTQTYTGNNKIEIQTKNWPAGYYIAEFRNGVNLISTQKIIVQ